MHTLEEPAHAARARRDAHVQRSHRPRERRNGEGGTPGKRAAVAFHTTLRATDAPADSVHFTGLATAYEQPYEMWDMYGPYTEVVSHGAAAITLARTDLDVPLVLQHQPLRRIARTTNGSLTLAETSAGLEVDAPALSLEDQDVAYIVPKIRAGLIDEMSFAFTIVRGSWSPDYTEYRIQEFDLHRGDVAIVAYGANPHTISTLRSVAPITEAETSLLHYLP